MQHVPKNLLTGWNILVIDDEVDSLFVAEIILKEYSANVHTATNGKQGLEVTRKIKPRLIICDLSMPEMDGWEFIEVVQKDRELSQIPVIALTAHAMVGDRERAITAGFHNYLTKPLTTKTFMGDLVKLLIDIPVLIEHLSILENNTDG